MSAGDDNVSYKFTKSALNARLFAEKICRTFRNSGNNIPLYENTLREPSYYILINIAKLLNVSTDELLGVKQTGDNYSQLFTLIKRLPESKLNTLCDFERFLSK